MKTLILTFLLCLPLLATPQSVAAQDPLERSRMQAVQSLERVLMEGADMDSFIEEHLTTSYATSMSRAALKDHLRTLSKSVSMAQALDISAEPEAILLIFSEGASATIVVEFAPEEPGKILHVGLRQEKSLEEMTPSERLAAAHRKRMKAIESIGNKSRDHQLDAFLDEHVSPFYLTTVSRNELLTSLRELHQIIAQSGIIKFEQTEEGSRLEFRGPQNANVLFALDPEEPYLISSLIIDTHVDVSNEEQETVTLSPITWDNLDQRLTEETHAGFSGVVLAVQNGNQVLRKGYGFSDKEANRLNSPSTLFDVGSIPIDFTIASIFKLQDDRKLSLTDPISSFFPGAPGDKAHISLNQLMTGQSGLPNFHHDPEKDNDYDLDWIDRAEAVTRIFNQQLLFEPGQGRAHSHSAFVLLAAVVEVASGTTYPDYVQTTFFNPMGMNNTGFYGEADRFNEDQFAVGYGYRAVAKKNIPLHWGPTSWLIMGSGGMFSTVDDLYTWMTEIRSGGYLSAAALEKYGTGGVASGISDRGFMATYINDPQNTIIYLTNTHEREGDVSMVLGETLARMVRIQQQE